MSKVGRRALQIGVFLFVVVSLVSFLPAQAAARLPAPGSRHASPAAYSPVIAPTQIKVGQSKSGTATYDNSAVFSLDVAAGQVYSLWLDYPKDQYANLTISDAGNNQVFPDLDENVANNGRPALVNVFTSSDKGPFSIELSGFQGAYKLSVSEGDKLSVTQGPISVGQPVDATINGVQAPIYTLDLSAPETVTVTLKTEGPDSGYTRVTGGPQDYVQASFGFFGGDKGLYDDTAHTAASVYRVDAAGQYNVQVIGVTGKYSLEVADGDILSVDSGALTLGDSHSGTVSGAQLPVFSVDVPPGQAFTLTLKVNEAAYPNLIDTTGNYLDYDNFSPLPDGSGQRRSYHATGQSPYQLSLSGVVGDYTVSLAEGDATVDHGGTLVLDTPVQDTVKEGETVSYSFDAHADQLVKITFDGPNAADAYVSVWDADRNLLQYQQLGSNYYVSGGSENWSVFWFQKPGTYSVKVGNFTGDYTLTLANAPGGSIAPGDSVRGTTVSEDDAAYYIFEAQPNEIVSVSVEPPTMGGGVTDGTEKAPTGVAYSQSDTAVTVSYKFAEAGKHVIIVGGKAGDYTLSLNQSEPVQLADGTPVQGDVGKGIVFYSFEGQAGGQVTVNWQSKSNFPTVISPDGQNLFPVDDHSANGTISGVFATEQAGTYLIGVDSGSAPYTLSIGDQVAAASGTDTGGNTGAASAGGSTCTVTASGGVNMRAEPNTTSAIVGKLAAGQTAEVDGQAAGAGGSKWWHLTTPAWVRSDTVQAGADCNGLPTVTP